MGVESAVMQTLLVCCGEVRGEEDGRRSGFLCSASCPNDLNVDKQMDGGFIKKESFHKCAVQPVMKLHRMHVNSWFEQLKKYVES